MVVGVSNVGNDGEFVVVGGSAVCCQSSFHFLMVWFEGKNIVFVLGSGLLGFST